ncbi:PD-(D/E)XK nuclease-like domain-containing protein, partial [Escherichia coli]|uniref:PD-(D/E)XK nuclease-like domain-containing protein n=1 Tax=Escherichia coli TaxID=562 RepID=UPI001F39B724
SVMLANPRHTACIESPTAQRELSIFGEIFGVKVKVRLDHVDVVSDPELIKEWGFNPDEVFEVVVITDYKTTQSSKPDDFGRLAFN